MTTIPLFNGFYDGLYRFLQSVSVSDEYLLRYHSYWRQLTSILMSKWSKMRKIGNFLRVNGHNTTFQWFLWWFISISEVCLCVRWIFIEIAHTLTSNDIILTSTLLRKWSKMRKIVNFDCVNGHNTTFKWILWWFA